MYIFTLHSFIFWGLTSATVYSEYIWVETEEAFLGFVFNTFSTCCPFGFAVAQFFGENTSYLKFVLPSCLPLYLASTTNFSLSRQNGTWQLRNREAIIAKIKHFLIFLIGFITLWLVHTLNVPYPCPPDRWKGSWWSNLIAMLGAIFFSKE